LWRTVGIATSRGSLVGENAAILGGGSAQTPENSGGLG
jgi:hypothetical protein